MHGVVMCCYDVVRGCVTSVKVVGKKTDSACADGDDTTLLGLPSSVMVTRAPCPDLSVWRCPRRCQLSGWSRAGPSTGRSSPR